LPLKPIGEFDRDTDGDLNGDLDYDGSSNGDAVLIDDSPTAIPSPSAATAGLLGLSLMLWKKRSLTGR
jgi:hypothetical protein